MSNATTAIETKVLTQDQRRDVLLRAIDLAKNPGNCVYYDYNREEPVCVVAQLAELVGIGAKSLAVSEITGELHFRRNGCSIAEHPSVAADELRQMFDPKTLSKLQGIWDKSLSIMEGRADMRTAVELHYREGEL